MPSVDTRAPASRAGAHAPTAPSSSAPTAPAPAAIPAGADGRLQPGTPAYRRAILALFAAGTATFLLLYSTQGLLPVLSEEFSASPGRTSLTVSLTSAALAVALLPVSTLSEKYGRLPVITVSITAAALIALAIPFSPNLTVLVVLRTLQGVALAGLPACAMAYLAEEVSPRALAGAVGLYVAGNSLGGMCSRVAAGWIAQFAGWRVALGVLGAVSLACAVAFVLLAPRARNFAPAPINPAAVLRTVRGHLGNPLLLRLYLLGMLFMSVFGSVYTVLAYRLTGAPFHLPEGVIGSLFLVYLVGTAASALSGRLHALVGRRGALYTGTAAVVAGLLLTLSGSLALILAGLALVTAGFFTGHTAASGSVSGTATTGRAQASALYMTAYYAGNSVGGTLGASAYHAAGWDGTTAVGLLAMVAAASVTLYGTCRARAGARPRPAAAGC